MRHVLLAFLNMVFLVTICSAGENPDLKDKKAKLSYCVGYQIGGDFLRQGKDISPEVLLKGVQDALAGKEPLMTQAEMRITLINLQQTVAAAQEQKMRARAKENLASGKTFLAENAKREGVKTLPSGLQYKVIKEGSGKSPQKSDAVTVHYRGTLIDGTEFDSSYSRNAPATFQVDRVIAGWKEALQLMKQGAKWQLFIPPELGYGNKRTGNIEPNSTLIFEVEFLSIN